MRNCNIESTCTCLHLHLHPHGLLLVSDRRKPVDLIYIKSDPIPSTNKQTSQRYHIPVSSSPLLLLHLSICYAIAIIKWQLNDLFCCLSTLWLLQQVLCGLLLSMTRRRRLLRGKVLSFYIVDEEYVEDKCLRLFVWLIIRYTRNLLQFLLRHSLLISLVIKW